MAWAGMVSLLSDSDYTRRDILCHWHMANSDRHREEEGVMARYKLEFEHEMLDPLKLGDTVWIQSKAIVSKMGADVVDITAYGTQGELEMVTGEVTVYLEPKFAEVLHA